MDCHQLSHGISIEKDCLHDCCLLRGMNSDGSPFIIKLDENNTVDWDKVFELKRSLKNIKIEDSHACKGCRALKEDLDFSKDDDYISFINLNNWNICNCRCIYCSPYYRGGDKHFNALPLIKSLAEYKDGSYLRNSGEVTFQGGEVTILPEFDDILNIFFEKNMKVRIHSNGIILSEAILKCLSKNLISIIISPDTAIKETYEKIKRVPCFDKVWSNIEKYAQAQASEDLVKAKFIVIPGINDTIEEIDAFIEKSVSCGLKHVIWEIEGGYLSCCHQDAPHVCLLIDYAMYKAKQAGLKDEFYDGAMYGMKNRKIPIANISNLEDFIKEYEKIKEENKEKNFNYLCFEQN